MWRANGSVLSYTNRSAATLSAATNFAATISAAKISACTQHAVACVCKHAVNQCAQSVFGAISMTRAYMQRLVFPSVTSFKAWTLT